MHCFVKSREEDEEQEEEEEEAYSDDEDVSWKVRAWSKAPLHRALLYAHTLGLVNLPWWAQTARQCTLLYCPTSATPSKKGLLQDAAHHTSKSSVTITKVRCSFVLCPLCGERLPSLFLLWPVSILMLWLRSTSERLESLSTGQQSGPGCACDHVVFYEKRLQMSTLSKSEVICSRCQVWQLSLYSALPIPPPSSHGCIAAV
eukprot:1138678-Pelagomonas_calceolata.AAC.8